MSYFFQDIVDITPSGTTGWQNKDISAHVPSNASMAVILSFTSGGSATLGARKPGSSENKTADLPNTYKTYFYGGISGQTVNLYKDSANAKYYLIGYFTDTECIVEVTGIDKSLAITGSFQDIDLSADVPVNAKFAIFQVISTATSYGFNFRKPGSSDNRLPLYNLGTRIDFLAPLSGQHTEGYIENTNVDFWLIGYITAGYVKPNGIDKSLGVTGSYQNIDLSANVPSSTMAVLIEAGSISGTPIVFSLRNSLSLEDYYANSYMTGGVATHIVSVPASRIIQGKIANVNMDFYITGYFESPGVPVADFSGIPLSGNVPLTVNFTDLSTGVPNYWEWDFGDGSAKSYSQNPSHIYSANGTYTVSLTVSNGYGYDTEIKVGYITVYNVGTVNVNLPFFDILSGSDGMILTLPMLTIGAGGMWTDFLKATMPMFNIQAFGLVLSNDILAELPMFTISAAGNAGIVGQLIASLPIMTISAVDVMKGVAILDLPIFTITAIGGISEIGTTILNLPMMQLISSAMTGEVGNINEILPMLQITGAGIVYFNVTGEAYLVLPKLRINASGMVIAVDTYTVYAINLRNAGISKYTNYNFNQFTKFGNLYLASSSSGIYTLTGNDDDGSAINAKITTGKISMGVDKLKRIVDFIFNLKAFGTPGANNYDAKMSTDDGVEYTYSFEDTNGIIHPVRVKTGKGKKGKFWTFKFLNKLGNDFELESIDIDVETTSRKT